MDGELELAAMQAWAELGKKTKQEIIALFVEAQEAKKEIKTGKWGGYYGSSPYMSLLGSMKSTARKALAQGLIDEDTFLLAFPNMYKTVDGRWGNAKWVTTVHADGHKSHILTYPDGLRDPHWVHPRSRMLKQAHEDGIYPKKSYKPNWSRW